MCVLKSMLLISVIFFVRFFEEYQTKVNRLKYKEKEEAENKKKT